MSKFQIYAKKYLFYFAPIMFILTILDFIVTDQKNRQLLFGDNIVYWLLGILHKGFSR